MNLTKKFLSVLTATFCAASACVCGITASAESVTGTYTSNGLVYVNVDEDDDNIYDHVRIVSCDTTAESLLIPKAIDGLVVKEISEGAFSNNTALISVDVNSENDYFKAVDGVLFDKNTSKLICYPSAKATKTYAIPTTVKEISDRAFANCTQMTTVTIPSSVTLIGDEAFEDCTSLAEISIPSSVASVGTNAFWGTELLNHQLINKMGPLYYADSWVIYADSNVTNVMVGATTIKTGTTGIAGGAFADCSDLTKVEIPSGVLYIGDGAFAQASSLSAVTIPSTTKAIGEFAFYDCDSIIELSVPNSVTSIGKFAFSDCSKLSKINIPTGITTIAESTFENCSALLEINVPKNVVKIEKLAFYNCAKLNKVTIHNTACDIKDASQTISNTDKVFEGTICGYEGSTAQAYAKTYNRLFETLGTVQGGKKGDANGDGTINVRDAAAIALALATNDLNSLKGDGDYNNDGKVNVRDAAAIATALATGALK